VGVGTNVPDPLTQAARRPAAGPRCTLAARTTPRRTQPTHAPRRSPAAGRHTTTGGA
jgi:hypothetical protein